MVDDNPDDVFVVQIAAEEISPPVQVDSADSGDQLLGWVEAGAEEPPTALLIDWHLPGTAAADVITRLRDRADWREVPIVVCSGGGEAALAEEAERLGADGFEPKPTSIDGVLAMIDRVLSLSSRV